MSAPTLAQQCWSDLTTPPKTLSVFSDPLSVGLLFAAVRCVHLGMAAHAALVRCMDPESADAALQMNLMFAPFVAMHWLTDNDTCIFAVGEGRLTGVPTERTLLYAVLGPLFTLHHTRYAGLGWAVVAAVCADSLVQVRERGLVPRALARLGRLLWPTPPAKGRA